MRNILAANLCSVHYEAGSVVFFFLEWEIQKHWQLFRGGGEDGGIVNSFQINTSKPNFNSLFPDGTSFSFEMSSIRNLKYDLNFV